MAREIPEPSTPPTAPDASARTFEGMPDLGVEEDLAAAERERALRGRGQAEVDEPVEEQPER